MASRIPAAVFSVPEVASTATDALSLARNVEDSLRESSLATVKFDSVKHLTPSYANALVMTLMERTRDEFEDRIQFACSSPYFSKMIEKSMDRFRRGLRLTTQRVGA